MSHITILFTTGMGHWFYGTLHDEIVYAFEQSDFPLAPRFETVVKQEEYGDLAAVMRLQKLEEEKVLDDAAALVVVPTESRRLTQKVAEVQLRRKLQGRPLPVVALNLPFRRPEEFTRRGLPVPKVVASHDSLGAVALGHDAMRYLKGRASPVRVVFIPGQHDRVDSQKRRDGFLEGLSEGLEGAVELEVTDLDPCSWNRRRAAKLMLTHLESARTTGVDAVFAANDEMALGARDAILAATGSFRGKVADCVVYGYDGTDEAAHLVEDGDAIFKGTVDQNLSEMTVRLATVLRAVLEGTAADGKPEYIHPHPQLQRPGVQTSACNGWAPPEYDPAPGKWLVAQEVAERDGVTLEALRQARSRRWARRRIERSASADSDWEASGIDRKGRIWIQQKARGKVWYLASSLRRPLGTRT